VRVAGLVYSDGARNLEVMLESLSGGRRREIQEDGIVMEVKKYFSVLVFNDFLCSFFQRIIMPKVEHFLNECTNLSEISITPDLVFYAINKLKPK